MARNNLSLFFFFSLCCACFRCRAATASSDSSSSLESSSQRRHYYPSKFDAEEMLLLNQKRVAVETSQIYDDLTGESGSFFENYYREEKVEEEGERDLSANAIVEKALLGARVSRESEEGVAIENAIQNVIKDAEMQLQNFLEASSSTTTKTTKTKTTAMIHPFVKERRTFS